jgi:hypothetical protein
LSLAVFLQSAITAPTPTPTPTNFLEPFETYFKSQQKTRSSSANLRSAVINPNTKVRSIEHRGGAFTKDRNYFEEFKIPNDFGNNFPEYSENHQSAKGTGNSQTGRIPQKNEYYSYSFRYFNRLLNGHLLDLTLVRKFEVFNSYRSILFINSTPVEDVSGDDVIAVVNVKHSPKVYFYQVQKKNLINGKR